MVGGVLGQMCARWCGAAIVRTSPLQTSHKHCRFADPMGLCNKTRRPASPRTNIYPPLFRSITMVSNELFQAGGGGGGGREILSMIGNPTDSVTSIAVDRAAFYFSLHFSVQTLSRFP